MMPSIAEHDKRGYTLPSINRVPASAAQARFGAHVLQVQRQLPSVSFQVPDDALDSHSRIDGVKADFHASIVEFKVVESLSVL